ncbi:MAG: hypothetical protein JK586_11140 [Nocardiopsis sp. BM-2018]|nr:MAG: hypothetical protein JK586_11140 [Nocardiopsis sp. BM-2018]
MKLLPPLTAPLSRSDAGRRGRILSRIAACLIVATNTFRHLCNHRVNDGALMGRFRG